MKVGDFVALKRDPKKEYTIVKKMGINSGPMRQYTPCQVWRVTDDRGEYWDFREDSLLLLDKIQLDYSNVQYGTLAEYHKNEGGYHSGVKIHFFNKKGVLIGNFYEFVSYERLRTRNQYPRYFMSSKMEGLKMWFFVGVCRVVTRLIKFTQKYMD